MASLDDLSAVFLQWEVMSWALWGMLSRQRRIHLCLHHGHKKKRPSEIVAVGSVETRVMGTRVPEFDTALFNENSAEFFISRHESAKEGFVK